MKKLILIISVLLASVVAGAQTATLTGSFDALKEENLLDAEIDFDKGVYKLIPVEQFVTVTPDWEQIKKETTDRFFQGINKTLKLTHKAAVKTGKQNFTIEVEIINVDDKGNTISNVQVCDSEGKAIAKIEHLYGKGGRYGTFCNLMGDGLESTGEKIGRMISYSILKKKYIDK
ncbi:MAG: hypothetical protein IK145_02565 [Bacteroidales bacterium]|jgi:hypothetical protein|nr:hypothetical protein [Bacteroidales bacterium]MBQ2531676.1 hypothetical protein [Bacteroidales bacterium]MBQ5411084.1 hypothetical protein [Bacteroidales bacterium]MBR5396716.1 hypothetical protein [Bacteroidales bacterium]MEE3476093.1 hypothetical protein [Candidatus Cryptobacteroides sp.]